MRFLCQQHLLGMCIFVYVVSLSAIAANEEAGTDFLVNNRFWVTRIKSANNVSEVLSLAKRNGFRFHKKVTGFPDTFIFESVLPAAGSHYLSWKRQSRQILEQEDGVVWAVQQEELKRDKRDVFYFDYDTTENGELEPDAPTNYRLPLVMHMDTNEISNDDDDDTKIADMKALWKDRHDMELLNRKHRPPVFNDELWDHEWYLQDTRSLPGLPKLDLNVLPVYRRGITGKNVRVAVLDDGLEYDHEDLAQNYDPEISYDCNRDNPDARPNYGDRSNSHGTRCAGEIAMVANNGKCGVGIAYNVKIGGIKLLGGKVYDLIEGMALGYAHDKVDIYSSSWGPTDDGRSLEKPGKLAQEAIQRGIAEGRHGLGSIFVWASGNGGSRQDNCNCDGYAASIYTITVGSASQTGNLPWYGEMCSAILTVTYSSGAYEDQMITTTDLHNKCTIRHTGTSASAPLAAGIIALGLEANPNTTWRDVQHLIVNSAEYNPLIDNEGWQKNAAGFWYHIGFGFGLMNADSYVQLAENWTNVGNQLSVELMSPSHMMTLFNSQDSPVTKIPFVYDDNSINFLEHVEVILDLDYNNRGSLEFYLTSPMETKVQLLGQRPRDKSRLGFKDWTLMSVATWSEKPQGTWILEIIDSTIGRVNEGSINRCILRLWGTAEQPAILKSGPRKYNTNYVRNIYM